MYREAELQRRQMKFPGTDRVDDILKLAKDASANLANKNFVATAECLKLIEEELEKAI